MQGKARMFTVTHNVWLKGVRWFGLNKTKLHMFRSLLQKKKHKELFILDSDEGRNNELLVSARSI